MIYFMKDEINNINKNDRDQREKSSIQIIQTDIKGIYKSIFEVMNNTPFAVVFVNSQEQITYISPKLVELMGYTLKDIPDTKTWFKKAFITKEELKQAESTWMDYIKRDNELLEPKTFRVLSKNGDEKFIRFTVVVTGDRNKFVFFEDITERKNFEEKITESEEMFRSIVENSHAGIIIVEGDFKFKYVNEQFCRMLGYNTSELEGKDFRDYLPDSSKRLVAQRYQQRQKGEKVPSDYQFEIKTKSGKHITVQISSAVAKDSKGNVKTIAQLLDITDNVNAEKKLSESEAKYRRLFESAGDAIFIMKDDLFIDCNGKTLELFNCEKSQIIGQPPYKFSPEKQFDGKNSKKKALEKIKGAFQGKPQHFEWLHKKYTGEVFYAEVSLNKVEIAGEDLIQAIVRDISKRKKVETMLKMRSEIENTINEISSTFISIPLDKIDSNITLALKKIVKLTSSDEGVLFRISDDHKSIRIVYRWGRMTNSHHLDEINIEKMEWWSGQILNNEAVCVPDINSLPEGAQIEKNIFENLGIKSFIDIPLNYKNEIIGFLGLNSKTRNMEFEEAEITLFNMLGQVFINVLQRKKTESDLRESEERLELALRGAELGLWDWDVQTGNVTYNENWGKILGYKPNDIKPHFETWQKLVHNEDYKKTRAALNDHVKGKTSFYEAEYRMLTKSGKWKWILDRGKVFERDKKGIALRAAGTILDITDKKNAEEALVQSEERFRSLFQNSAFGIYQTTLDGKFELCNDAFLAIFGYKSFEELVEKENTRKFYISPKDRENFISRLLINGRISGSEVEYKNAKGELVYVREYAQIVNVNGRNLIEGAVEDITDKKQAEMDMLRAKEKAEASDKLKSEFLAQMSHEIRTPINTVLSFASLLKDDLSGKLSSDLEESFGVMNRAGKRIIRTIDLLLDMSQMQTGTYEINFKSIDLCEKILKNITDEYHYAAKEKNINFEIVEKGKDNTVLGDEYTIGQIVHNLVDNAIKYTDKGNVKVIIGREKSSKVYIKVADTGIGISKDYLPNLFKPFTQEDQGYTRKYEGNGLGLALVKSYCELNNARISVTSKKGKGTTFKVLFNTIANR